MPLSLFFIQNQQELFPCADLKEDFHKNESQKNGCDDFNSQTDAIHNKSDKMDNLMISWTFLCTQIWLETTTLTHVDQV